MKASKRVLKVKGIRRIKGYYIIPIARPMDKPNANGRIYKMPPINLRGVIRSEKLKRKLHPPIPTIRIKMECTRFSLAERAYAYTIPVRNEIVVSNCDGDQAHWAYGRSNREARVKLKKMVRRENVFAAEITASMLDFSSLFEQHPPVPDIVDAFKAKLTKAMDMSDIISKQAAAGANVRLKPMHGAFPFPGEFKP